MINKEETLIVLFNLKEGVSIEEYEEYAVNIDSPCIKKLPSNKGFKILKGLHLFGTKTKPPYQYMEVMSVTSFEDLSVDIQKEEVQEMLEQFSGFVDRPQLIVTKQIN